jgi:hypothetical protein
MVEIKTQENKMKRQEVRKTIGFIALLLFPATIFYMSPYLSVIGPASGIITGSLIYFFILFISALFLRRAHCGWTCISTGVHDAGLFFITKKVGMKSRIIKYFIWAPWASEINSDNTRIYGRIEQGKSEWHAFYVFMNKELIYCIKM